jgi:GT2 family glycosyltransferase
VVLVARDEPLERIDRALASVAAQDYDGPVEILVASPDPVAVGRWVPNPTGGRSAGLNLGIASAAGEIVCRVDARTQLPTNYIRLCVDRLRDPSVGVVGGGQRAVAGDNTRRARRIARALRNPWLLGGASYRRPGANGPTDTVYLGAFRRADLLAVGGYDEALDANEDFELCQRFRRAGFTVWLEACDVDYEARTSLRAVWHQYVAFGRSKVRYWRRTGERPNVRQLVAIAGAPAAPLLLAYDAASAAIVCGWLFGVFAEAIRRSPTSDRARPSPAPQSLRQPLSG